MASSNLKTVLGAFLTWLVPLVVSFALYNSQTKIYFPSYLGFKVIMVLVAAAACFVTMRWVSKNHVLTLQVPGIYIFLNSILDLLVLVSAFKMSLTVWATTVLPVYGLVFGFVYLILRR